MSDYGQIEIYNDIFKYIPESITPRYTPLECIENRKVTL